MSQFGFVYDMFSIVGLSDFGGLIVAIFETSFFLFGRLGWFTRQLDASRIDVCKRVAEVHEHD